MRTIVIGKPEGSIIPFYFGTPIKSLFGCYHAPQAEFSRACSVVLCSPIGYEYILSHRAYVQLAMRLSRSGFHVLRFDHYGCGDSGGDDEAGSPRQWCDDIATAIGEIQRRSGVAKVCLVGLRLGATLAMAVGVERYDIAGMVLWDPIVSGKVYMKELTSRHRARLRIFPALLWGCQARKQQVLGFPMTEGLRTELEKIDMLTIQQKPAHDLLIIETCTKRGNGRNLTTHLQELGAHAEYQFLPSTQIWIENLNRVLVPHRVLQSVTAWISKVCP